jgi:hypothetical protein
VHSLTALARGLWDNRKVGVWFAVLGFGFGAAFDALAAERAANEQEAERARDEKERADEEAFSRSVLKHRRGRERR